MLPLQIYYSAFAHVFAHPRLSVPDCRAACALLATALLLFGNGKAQEKADKIDALIQQIRSSDKDTHTALSIELGRIRPSVIPRLVDMLKDPDLKVRRAAVIALGTSGPKAVPALIIALKDPEKEIRRQAANTLGWRNLNAKEAVPALIIALDDQDEFVRGSAAFSLDLIATESFDSKGIEMIPQLRKAYEKMKGHADPDLQFFSLSVGRMLIALEALQPSSWNIIRGWIINHPYWTAIIGIYLLLIAAWLLLLWLRPLWLLRLSEFFRWNVKLKPLGVEFDFPSRHLLLISLFHHRPRVLNAWVCRHLDTARENFANKQTVAQRKVYVVMPTTINEQMRDSVSAALIQPIFDKRKITLLIAGEGGAGKTSLACQIAAWAMADELEQRLCKSHRMLPVLIEGNLPPRDDKKNLLVEAVRGQMGDLIGETEPIFDELLIQLLRKRRVLVIVDSLSELDEATRKSVCPAEADFPVAALLVTSRIDELLGGASKSLLRPLRLKSDRLSTFMDRYLEQLGKRDLFNDDEYFEACRKLSQLVSDREITVLIAKLYAEQMIASKEADAGAQPSGRELPRNLPDLMLGYVKRLNDQVKAERQDIRKVINVAKVVAWECLKQTCRPTTAKRADVVKALNNEADAETLLNYLDERLRIIQKAGPYDDLIRFSLDPLAEYLAAQYLVERCGKFEDVWGEFFENADKQPGAPKTIKGFLQAMRDCCLEKSSEFKVPEWVGGKFARLAGLDMEEAKSAQLKQRINRLIADLKLPDADDRRTAAEKLGQVGPEAKEAVPALITALNDQSEETRRSAASALGRVGPEAKEVVLALIAALNDQRAEVRRSAADALGRVGPGAKEAVPALIIALNGRSEETRRSAVNALGRVGLGVKEVVPALIAALNDSSKEVRRSAAVVLGRIGPEAKEAVPALIAALKDQKYEVMRSAVGDHAKP